MNEIQVRGSWVKRSITWGFLATSVAVGASVGACGNSPPPASPDTTASAPASTTAAPEMTASAAPTATTAPEPTTTATTPPPPPPVTMPASFTAAQTTMFAQADRLGDAVSSSGSDCGKMGAALEKVANDAAFTKAVKDYVAEALKLTPEQRDAAKAQYEQNQKKYDSMGDAAKACDKNARVKGAVKKIMKTMMSSLEPLMKAFAGGAAPAGSAAPATSAAPKK